MFAYYCMLIQNVLIRNIILHSILQDNKIFCYIVEQRNAYLFLFIQILIYLKNIKNIIIFDIQKKFLIKKRHILI